VASACAQASQETWPSVSAITNASYHAGVAERLLGERYQAAANASEASIHFAAAAELLERAISLAPQATSGRPRPPAKADGMLELAWVRFDQGSYQAARAQIDELLRLESNPESAIHASAHYLRGRTFAADGQPLAALTDWGVFVDDALDQHPYAMDARSQIISLATRVGMEALARNSQADAESAIESFSRAQAAAEAGEWAFQWPISYGAGEAVDQAGIFVNLGRARLDLAGFHSRDGFADFACAPEVRAPDLLNLARADFESATQKNDRDDAAWRELSCAELALGRVEAAVAAAEHAREFAPASGVDRAEDYRMLGRARARLSSAAGAAAAFEEARLHAPTNQWRSRVLTELAAVYTSTQEFDRARERLLEAVGSQSGDPSYAEAFLGLSANYFAGEGGAPDFANAEPNLLSVERLTDPRHTMHEVTSHERDRTVRAEGLYYLSRLRIEWPGHYNGQQSVSYADEAFQLDGSSRNRAQACLARVRLGTVSMSSPTQGYCSAIGQASPSPDSYLYEGVYHLRRAQFAGGGDNHRALEAAYRAFSEGLRLLPADADRLLHAKLLQGQATAQYCIGFAQVGHDLEASIARTIGGDRPEDVAEAAHRFFDDYRVMTCNGSEHAH
jgi:tetratricopeptide (TPR) repeat protein